jgi:hypothetical protein
MLYLKLSAVKLLHFEKGKKMKVIVTSIISVLVLIVGLSVPAFAVHHGGNRCTDRCADNYRIKKDACDLIPLKHERKICERRAKEAKNDCKHRCH